MISTDIRKLNRMAIEPTRVFSFTEVRDVRVPILRLLAEDGASWFGPGLGSPWVVRGDDCTVLRRAIEKLGIIPADSERNRQLGELLSAPGLPVEPTDPQLIQASSKHLLAVYRVGEGFVPAVPIAYTQRRWPGGTWNELSNGVVLRYEMPDGAMALVARLDRKG